MTDRQLGTQFLRSLALAASVGILVFSGALYSEATYTPTVPTIDSHRQH